MSDSVLILNNISKSYNQGNTIINILTSINLEVKAGEVVGIIGSSGSGKSTLLHIAGLLDSSDSGFIEVAGKKYGSNINNASKSRLHDIGFVYQFHHLLDNFTALENIAIPRLINNISYDLALKDAKELINILGMENRASSMPNELSGGEAQRVAIARSLINKPKIILADEPTGNLDPKTAKEVFKMFLDIAQYKKTAILMVTHNHELSALMNRVYILKDGILEKN